MTRSVLRFVSWRIARDESAPHVFQMECVACTAAAGRFDPEAASPASEDGADAQLWALRHSGRHPGHTEYRERVTRHWRTDVVGGDGRE